MARICIVTPGQIGSNPRAVKEAQTLHDAGHGVQVIATRMLDRIEARDQDVLAAAPWLTERIDLTSRTSWRWRRVRQILARGLFLAGGRASFADMAAGAAARDLLGRALRVPADLYIAHYAAALPAAAAAARRHGALYAFDAEDFHLGELPGAPGHEAEKRLIRAVEGRWLPGCAYITAASPGIASAYAGTYGLPQPVTVLNVFPRRDAPPGPTPSGTAALRPSLYWFSQTIGPDRGLECAVRAIGLAQTKPHLFLRGTPAPGYAAHLCRLAAHEGVANHLHLLPPEVPSEMVRLAAACDAGLGGETGHTPSRRVALTNKLFTYLLAGIPAVLSDIPAHRAIARDAGPAIRLYRTDDPAALASALDGLFHDPAALAAARTAAWRLGQDRYNWDLEQRKLLALVPAVLERARGAQPCRAGEAALLP